VPLPHTECAGYYFEVNGMSTCTAAGNQIQTEEALRPSVWPIVKDVLLTFLAGLLCGTAIVLLELERVGKKDDKPASTVYGDF
jgi:hypothetical protein